MNKRINICPTALDMTGQAYQGLGEQKTATAPPPIPSTPGPGWVGATRYTGVWGRGGREGEVEWFLHCGEKQD